MKSTRCQPCRQGKHEECDGTIPRRFDEAHDRACECWHRETRADAKAMTKKKTRWMPEFVWKRIFNLVIDFPVRQIRER